MLRSRLATAENPQMLSSLPRFLKLSALSSATGRIRRADPAATLRIETSQIHFQVKVKTDLAHGFQPVPLQVVETWTPRDMRPTRNDHLRFTWCKAEREQDGL